MRRRARVPFQGLPHEVVFKAVAMREGPSRSSEEVTWLANGTTVYVLDYDGSRQWVRAQVDKLGVSLTGWILLAHGDFGELLRPKV